MTNDSLYENVRQHIHDKFQGIYTPEHMERHFNDYVGFEVASYDFQLVRDYCRIKPGDHLLDIGCGFGSFVLVALRDGVAAEGIDIAEYDIDFARQRLAAEKPGLRPEDVYHLGNGQDTGLPEASFDVVTVWNLLEHVPDYKQLIREAYRLLKPGGYFIGLAPNYLAFRKEAHYQVPWLPLLPRRLAHEYLLRLKLDPRFFDEDIHYVTTWGVHRTLIKTGFHADYPEKAKLANPEVINSKRLQALVLKFRSLRLLFLIKIFFWLTYWNPFKWIIFFFARKPLK